MIMMNKNKAFTTIGLVAIAAPAESANSTSTA